MGLLLAGYPASRYRSLGFDRLAVWRFGWSSGVGVLDQTTDLLIQATAFFSGCSMSR
ncbi:hypothetical protein ACLB1Q_17615 [Escherichia coli]